MSLLRIWHSALHKCSATEGALCSSDASVVRQMDLICGQWSECDTVYMWVCVRQIAGGYRMHLIYSTQMKGLTTLAMTTACTWIIFDRLLWHICNYHHLYSLTLLLSESINRQQNVCFGWKIMMAWQTC